MSEILNVNGKKYTVTPTDPSKALSLTQPQANHEKINNSLNHKLTSIVKATCLGPAFWRLILPLQNEI